MKILLYTLLAMLLVQGLLVTYQLHIASQSRIEARQETCRKLAALDRTLINLIRDSEAGLTGVSYYRSHPAELRIVIANDERAIRALTPPNYC